MRGYRLELWGCSSVGERLLCKQEVTGSNPVSSTRRYRIVNSPVQGNLCGVRPSIGESSSVSMA